MRLPSKEQLDYWRTLLTTVLIALVFPLLIHAIFTHPHETTRRLAGGLL